MIVIALVSSLSLPAHNRYCTVQRSLDDFPSRPMDKGGIRWDACGRLRWKTSDRWMGHLVNLGGVLYVGVKSVGK
jgi:hypothetical protein